MRRRIVVVVVLAISLAGGVAAAETAAQWFERGRAARANNDFPAAVKAFREAYRQQPNSVTAVLLAESAAHVPMLSSAMKDLRTWLVRKRDEARTAGDEDASWGSMETMLDAYADAVAGYERRLKTLKEEIVGAQQQLLAQETIVKGYELAKAQWAVERKRLEDSVRMAAEQRFAPALQPE